MLQFPQLQVRLHESARLTTYEVLCPPRYLASSSVKTGGVRDSDGAPYVVVVSLIISIIQKLPIYCSGDEATE